MLRRCPICRKWRLWDVRLRQTCATFENEDLNWQLSCKSCFDTTQEFYEEQWREYNSSRA